MERFLLFDSACSRCSQLVRSIEEASDGWLSVKSLHEESAQVLLSGINLHWKWKPTLVEVEGEEKRLFTGIRLSVHLLRCLGPQKTWKIFQAIYRASLSSQSTQLADPSRRRLWKRTGAVLASLSVSLGIGNLVFHPQALAASSSVDARVAQLSPEELQRIAQLPSVLQSNSSLGTRRWVEGYQFRQKDGTGGYVLIHESGEAPQTFVGVSEPTSTGAVASIAGRIVPKNQDTAEIQWFATNGQMVAVTTMQRSGAVSTIPTTETPDLFCSLGCFAGCVNESGVAFTCAFACVGCALGINDCSVCVLCAGIVGAACAGRCCSL